MNLFRFLLTGLSTLLLATYSIAQAGSSSGLLLVGYVAFKPGIESLLDRRTGVVRIRSTEGSGPLQVALVPAAPPASAGRAPATATARSSGRAWVLRPGPNGLRIVLPERARVIVTAP